MFLSNKLKPSNNKAAPAQELETKQSNSIDNLYDDCDDIAVSNENIAVVGRKRAAISSNNHHFSVSTCTKRAKKTTISHANKKIVNDGDAVADDVGVAVDHHNVVVDIDADDDFDFITDKYEPTANNNSDSNKKKKAVAGDEDFCIPINDKLNFLKCIYFAEVERKLQQKSLVYSKSSTTNVAYKRAQRVYEQLHPGSRQVGRKYAKKLTDNMSEFYQIRPVRKARRRDKRNEETTNQIEEYIEQHPYATHRSLALMADCSANTVARILGDIKQKKIDAEKKKEQQQQQDHHQDKGIKQSRKLVETAGGNIAASATKLNFNVQPKFQANTVYNLQQRKKQHAV